MLNIVLYQPEIPENTGNIARTCVAFNAKLHLIRPYGFFLNNSKLKRSAVNYWDKLNLEEYDTYDEFVEKNSITEHTSIYFLTRYGTKTPSSIKYDIKNDVFFIFGKESTGISKDILNRNINRTIRIPTSSNVRALNLSNCVAMLAYDYIKKNDFSLLEKIDPFNKN